MVKTTLKQQLWLKTPFVKLENAMIVKKDYREVDLSPAQCRAARGLLDWKQDLLAERSQVSVNAIRTFENGKTKPTRGTITSMVRAFQEAGLMFVSRQDRLEDGSPCYVTGVALIESPYDDDQFDIPLDPDHRPMTVEEARAVFTQFDAEDLAAMQRLGDLVKKLKK
jgi:transcriptional regulator with XRE-family HTH domain